MASIARKAHCIESFHRAATRSPELNTWKWHDPSTNACSLCMHITSNYANSLFQLNFTIIRPGKWFLDKMPINIKRPISLIPCHNDWPPHLSSVLCLTAFRWSFNPEMICCRRHTKSEAADTNRMFKTQPLKAYPAVAAEQNFTTHQKTSHADFVFCVRYSYPTFGKGGMPIVPLSPSHVYSSDVLYHRRKRNLLFFFPRRYDPSLSLPLPNLTALEYEASDTWTKCVTISRHQCSTSGRRKLGIAPLKSAFVIVQ